MAEYPALPLFTDAFISDTTHLTAAQTGAYIMLLFHAWRARDCALPDDDRILARMARMDGRAWASQKGVVMSFWDKVDVDGVQKWVQRRLLDERKFVDLRSRKNAEAGKASALKRLNRRSTTVATKRQPKTNEPTPTPMDNIPPLIPPTTQTGVKNHEPKLSPARAAARRGLEAVNRKFGFDAGE